MMGKKKLYLALLARFIEGQRHTSRDITAALVAGDVATPQRLAHTVRGVSGSIGATALQGVAGELEQALKDGVVVPALKPHLHAFHVSLAALVSGLCVGPVDI